MYANVYQHNANAVNTIVFIFVAVITESWSLPSS